MKLLKVIFCVIVANLSFAYNNYHGCALAPGNIGWVVTLDSTIILHTTNGGANWHEQANTATREFFDVCCVDNLKAWTCGILGEILHTDDGGINWIFQNIGLGKYATRIEFIDQNYGWAAAADGAIGRTTDGGAYWDQNFAPFLIENYGLSFVNPMAGWMVSGIPDSLLTGQGCIINTTDGGVTWDSLYQSPSYEDFYDVHFFNDYNGIVVGGYDQTYAPIIFKTTNGGLTWNQISSPSNAYYLRAVDFVGDKGWAVGRFGTIIHTTNQGSSWTFQTNPATMTLFDVDFSDTLHGVACGYNIILYTTDGGQTWYQGSVEIQEEQNLGVPNRNLKLEVYPNPFNENLTIKFQIPNPKAEISLKIYDTRGKLVKAFNLQSSILNLTSVITWHGDDNNGHTLPSGIYFIKLETGSTALTREIILLK